MPNKGELQVVATPIGNLEDISLRATRAIFEADFVICEDTRAFGLLYQRLVKSFSSLLMPPVERPRLIAHYEGNEAQSTPEILALLLAGQKGVLTTNAGTPLVSDPGFGLVKGALEAGIKVTGVPGPSAAVTALSVSGLSADRFVFVGFLPKKTAKRERVLTGLEAASGQFGLTAVFYESPFRVKKLVVQLAERWPEAQAVVARELTKLHEETVCGSLPELADKLPDKIKGEVVLLVRLEKS